LSGLYRRFPIGRLSENLARLNCRKIRRLEALRVRRACEVAQVSNLPYRRFPIGRSSENLARLNCRKICRLEALRYSRLETCATHKQKLLCIKPPSSVGAAWLDIGEPDE
jgi:hypothetical protein